MLAGMAGVAYSELVAAVSEAGGFGCLGASTMSPDEMVREMQAVRQLTERPFGVDLLTALPGDLTARVQSLIDHGASVFVAGLGVPTEVIRLCHDHGVLVVSMCGKVTHALRAVEAGCDLVVAQGTEAGGHTGQVATLPLVPQVVDAVAGRVPVVAAGGIFDGRGLAAALCLGAVGVWVGTRFIATHEARAVAGYKDRLLSTGEDGTVITRAFTGKTLRAVRNSYTDHFERNPGELEPFPQQVLKSTSDGAFHLGGDAQTEGIDPDKECFAAGQGIGAIQSVVPAADLVRSFVKDAEQVLAMATG